MLQFKARLDIKNCQGLTPLTLAAKLAKKEVEFFNLCKSQLSNFLIYKLFYK